MSEHSTPDPLEALVMLCSGESQEVMEKLANNVAPTFYGPHSTFVAAVKATTTSPNDAARWRKVLTTVPEAVSKLENVPLRTWQRYWQLALLNLGNSQRGDEPCFNPDAAIGLCDEASDKSMDCRPTEAERESLEGAIAKLEGFGWKKGPEEWTAADWRLLGFVNDGLSDSSGMIERTPIFLANEQLGKVLWLVAERVPGPPRLITPHWWRLGLVPLGGNDELLEAVHFGFRAVLGAFPETRYQIRWWLEASTAGGKWHDAIAEAPSVQVAAGCLANALHERKPEWPPLLDPHAGVSASLGGVGGTALNARPVGSVGFIPKKIQAAAGAGTLTFLLEAGCARHHSQTQTPQIQPVTTFSDAYEALLATATPLQQYKKRVASAFIPLDDTETTDGKDKQIEVRTLAEFFVSDDHEAGDVKNDENDVARLTQAAGAEHFLLGQPIWCAEAGDETVRWNMAEREDEPSDDASKSDFAHRPAPMDDDQAKGDAFGTWVRVARDDFLKCAVSEDDTWQHVGLVCGAGLGKTTNLRWLGAVINRLDNGRGKNLAVFLDLAKLKSRQQDVKQWIVNHIVDQSGEQDAVAFAVDRALTDGRVIFLLDSLDQANPDPAEDAVQALHGLMTGRWNKCRVWVSGRPYAFRIARPALERIDGKAAWQFFRIGQLDEPECRQLLETFHRP